MDDAGTKRADSLRSVDMARPPLVPLPSTGLLVRLRRAVLARRRLLAAVLAGLAVLATVRALEDPVAPSATMVVAAHDLGGGETVTPDDLRVVAVGPDLAPAGAIGDPDQVVGRVLAAPVRTGEAVTDVRLVAPGLLEGYPGSVAVPVRLADAGTLGLLRVGDIVEVLAADPTGAGSVAEVLTRAPVVALPRPEGHGTAAPWSDGGLAVLAVPPTEAGRLAQAGVTSVLSVALVR